jgi:hypothetical protein
MTDQKIRRTTLVAIDFQEQKMTGYYFPDKENNRKATVYYGPLPSLEMAKYFSAFHRNGSYKQAPAESYTQREIETLLDDPGETERSFQDISTAIYADGAISFEEVTEAWNGYRYERYV